MFERYTERARRVLFFARYEASQDRDVALKIIGPSQDEHTRKQFEHEARAAATVSHPNICQIHEIGEDGATLFIAMELLSICAIRRRHSIWRVNWPILEKRAVRRRSSRTSSIKAFCALAP
jgi:serine/threonine protein kinase